MTKKKIAMFSTGWCAEILSQFLAGMTEALSHENADIFLFLCYPIYYDTQAMKQGEMNIFNLPDLHDFDGTVIFGSGLDYKETVDLIIARSREAGIPVVMQGSKRDDIIFVGSDSYQATKDMCEHLTKEHGVKTISFLAGTKDSYDSELRLKALRDYLKDNGRENDLQEVFYSNWENAVVTRHVNEICTSGQKLPDAIICANDGIAMETCISLGNNGIEVPRDVLVTGYDFLDISKVFDPSIASVDQCFDKMGAAAVKLLNDHLNGETGKKGEVIPCKFVPGESCNCYEYRDSDKERRTAGRNAYFKRSMTTYFNRKLDIIDNTVLSCMTYQDLKQKLNKLLTDNHDFEGDSFHVILEPNFSLSIYDPNIRLNTDGYSKNMEIIYSMEDGVICNEDLFASRNLVPGYKSDGANHLYVFMPVHEADSAFGYVVFRDCLDKFEDRFLHTYYNRMGLVFDKFRHALTLDLINKRLLDLMRRDALTNVNNRMAYDDKQKYLQGQINSESDLKFAIAMFDVNNLKLINDTEGHESGDAYLIRACHLICNVFKHSPVYRMGGDEFAAVLCGEDYDNHEALRKKFNESLSPYSETMPLPPDYVSVACGISVFNPDTDSTVTDVIRRADEAMYKDKASKKTRSK